MTEGTVRIIRPCMHLCSLALSESQNARVTVQQLPTCATFPPDMMMGINQTLKKA